MSCRTSARPGSPRASTASSPASSPPPPRAGASRAAAAARAGFRRRAAPCGRAGRSASSGSWQNFFSLWRSKQGSARADLDRRAPQSPRHRRLAPCGEPVRAISSLPRRVPAPRRRLAQRGDVGGGLGQARGSAAAAAGGGGAAKWGLVRYLALAERDRPVPRPDGGPAEFDGSPPPPLLWFKYQSKPPDGQAPPLLRLSHARRGRRCGRL